MAATYLVTYFCDHCRHQFLKSEDWGFGAILKEEIFGGHSLKCTYCGNTDSDKIRRVSSYKSS
jgi:DNA-directed RNA polymerase subunit RPC12/RpoP